MSMTEQFNETVNNTKVRNVTSNATGYLVLHPVPWPKLPVWFYAAYYDIPLLLQEKTISN